MFRTPAGLDRALIDQLVDRFLFGIIDNQNNYAIAVFYPNQTK